VSNLRDTVGLCIPYGRADSQYETEFEPATATLWGYFNPNQDAPCFSLGLLKDIASHDEAFARDGGHVEIEGRGYQANHYVLASRTPRVFNMGGDLALFSMLIKSQDRHAIGSYAKLCIDNMYRRIQNFRSWSPEMLPDGEHSSIGMEYFCNEGDELWEKDNATLVKLAEQELRKLDLVGDAPVVDGTVIRQPKAYPVYDHEYQEALDVIRDWLDNFPNLQLVGRNGMHRYNNQDHSMLTAMLAVKNILGEQHDLWSVNVEQEYHEEEKPAAEPDRSPQYAERLQPVRVLAEAS